MTNLENSHADCPSDGERKEAEFDGTVTFVSQNNSEVGESDSALADPGSHIGPYRLLQQIGEGGMGVVYMAEQIEPLRRRLALKIIKPGMDSSRVIRRFEAERQALALMDHVNIAKVLDAGTTETGRPYFVMELVSGVPITKYCEDGRLTVRERLELFVPVCRAIQHAHQKGIIHRDIKPSNVLITMQDGKPTPKIIDFGLAKAIDQRLTEQTMFTQQGEVIGTVAYMSPEQAEMSALGVDTRSDIYSLGSLLYELLTGSTPLDRESLQEAGFVERLRMIKEEEASPPSSLLSNSATLSQVAAGRRSDPAKLTKLIKGELDWVVMKCLEKERTRRYETTTDLARDIENFLSDEPVQACPASVGFRLRRFVRRNKKSLGSITAFVVLLIAAVVVSTLLALQAKRERDAARMEIMNQLRLRLWSELQQLEPVGLSFAAHLRNDVMFPDQIMDKNNEERNKNYMKDMMTDRRIFGLALALEKEDYMLYAQRTNGKIVVERMDQAYREMDWYKSGLKAPPRWSPRAIKDPVANNELLIAYIVPLVDATGNVVGVLTVDVSIKEFFKDNNLKNLLNQTRFGQTKNSSYGFVISNTSAPGVKTRNAARFFPIRVKKENIITRIRFEIFRRPTLHSSGS